MWNIIMCSIFVVCAVQFVESYGDPNYNPTPTNVKIKTTDVDDGLNREIDLKALRQKSIDAAAKGSVSDLELSAGDLSKQDLSMIVIAAVVLVAGLFTLLSYYFQKTMMADFYRIHNK